MKWNWTAGWMIPIQLYKIKLEHLCQVLFCIATHMYKTGKERINDFGSRHQCNQCLALPWRPLVAKTAVLLLSSQLFSLDWWTYQSPTPFSLMSKSKDSTQHPSLLHNTDIRLRQQWQQPRVIRVTVNLRCRTYRHLHWWTFFRRRDWPTNFSAPREVVGFLPFRLRSVVHFGVECGNCMCRAA